MLNLLEDLTNHPDLSEEYQGQLDFGRYADNEIIASHPWFQNTLNKLDFAYLRFGRDTFGIHGIIVTLPHSDIQNDVELFRREVATKIIMREKLPFAKGAPPVRIANYRVSKNGTQDRSSIQECLKNIQATFPVITTDLDALRLMVVTLIRSGNLDGCPHTLAIITSAYVGFYGLFGIGVQFENTPDHIVPFLVRPILGDG